MDKEEARFILGCFRPDGADAADPEFAEALQLAAADRELGEWLARERARDAEFADSLGKLSLPEGLREEIMAGFAAERGDRPEADDFDSPLIGALAAVKPPEGLRREILTAMQRSAPETEAPAAERKSSVVWWRFGLPLAAAAGIALAFFVNQGPTGGTIDDPIAGVPAGKTVPVSFVQKEAIATLENNFSLDLKNQNHQALFDYLESKDRPCAEGCLPKHLKEVVGRGCRVIEMDGKPGAIICFDRTDDEVVHLVVFRREDVAGELPGETNPQFEQVGKWAAARWVQDGRVFVLLGETDVDHLGELF